MMPRSTDPTKAARQEANLLPGPSPDPAARERQLANLQHGRSTHGAKGGAALEAARDRHDVDLAADYPRLDRRRRALLADRLARVELASAFVREHGIGPSTKAKRGEVYSIADRLESWSRRAEDMLADAEEQHAEGNESPASLESITAELAAGDGDSEPGTGTAPTTEEA